MLKALQIPGLKVGKHQDLHGLRLIVSASGSRRWAVQVTVKGHGRREFGLGSWPVVGLAKARELALEARRAASEGRAYNQVPEAAAAVPTVREVLGLYLESHGPGFRNAKHRAQWSSSLETHAGALMDLEVSKVDVEAVLRVLTPIWNVVPETASRVRGRLATLIELAQARGWHQGRNPADARLIGSVLPKPRQIVSHFAALPYAELPALVGELRALGSVSARALLFAIAMAARSGEVRGALWDEIDLEARTWTIPAERMKAGRVHVVPLNDLACEALGAPARGLVFPSRASGRELSQMALTMCLRGLREGCTVHGMRSAFRDWAAERTRVPREVAEAALAHVNGDRVEAAYLRSDRLEERRRLMDAWGRYCCPTNGSVVPLVALSRAL